MILVTGGSGLVGKELITQLLAQGRPVTATYHNTPLADFHSPFLKQIHCDILDVAEVEEAMQGIEQVYHCAAIVSFNKKNKHLLSKINIEGTANIVNAALDAGVKKLVHVSSVAALSGNHNGEMITEKMNWSDKSRHSNYAKSKYLSEMEVWRGMGEGLNIAIVNPTIILGAGSWHAGSSQIFKTVYDEFPWYSDGTNGFVDVKDVVRAIILLMESDVTGERFILCGANKSYEDVFKMIASKFNKKPPYKKVSPFIAQIVWRLEAIKSFFSEKDPLVTKETTASALAKRSFDNTKFMKFFPHFSYTPFEETITNTCSLFQQELNNH